MTILELILLSLVALLMIAVLILALKGRKPDSTLFELKGAVESALAQSAQSEQALRQEMSTQLSTMRDTTTTSLSSLTDRTQHSLSALSERLSLIDQAQKHMTAVAGDVSELRNILSNKQTRGAFGEMRLTDIIENVFPNNAYSFQHTLSNGKRVDALILDTHSSLPIPIDAKFPLESYRAILDSVDKPALERARRTFKTDLMAHIKAVSEKYILPGETGESVLMFLPAESIYSELHTNFQDVVEEAMRRNVWITSPTTLMAVLITLRGLARDSLVFKEADKIRKELDLLQKDVGRLHDRSLNLERHLAQAHGDLDGITTSADKIQKRATRLSTLDFS